MTSSVRTRRHKSPGTDTANHRTLRLELPHRPEHRHSRGTETPNQFSLTRQPLASFIPTGGNIFLKFVENLTVFVICHPSSPFSAPHVLNVKIPVAAEYYHIQLMDQSEAMFLTSRVANL